MLFTALEKIQGLKMAKPAVKLPSNCRSAPQAQSNETSHVPSAMPVSVTELKFSTWITEASPGPFRSNTAI